MKLIYRKIIGIIFIVIFLIATPLILLYTSGYRYNIQKGRVQKTGILILSTVPRKAEIFLNGKLVEGKTTPAEIKNVLPGDYEIRLQKDGYHTWDKKLPVYENYTTFAEKIILWKEARPEILNQSLAKLWMPSPDKQKVAIIDENNDLYLFSLSDQSFNLIGNPKNAVKQIIWSNTNGKVILVEDNIFEIYNTDNRIIKPTQINGYLSLYWPQSGDGLVYGINNKGVWEINLIKNSKRLIDDSANIDDLMIDGSNLYSIHGKQISQQTPNGSSTKQNLTQTYNSGYKFLRQDYGKIILTNNAGSMAIIDKSNTFRPIEINAKSIEWLNQNIFLYYNDFEIWIYDLNKGQAVIITRVSQPINQAIWHPLGKHIIYSSANQIDIIEVDDRELRNLITLADNTKADYLSLSPNDKILYFSGNWNSQKGIFQLNLQ